MIELDIVIRLMIQRICHRDLLNDQQHTMCYINCYIKCYKVIFLNNPDREILTLNISDLVKYCIGKVGERVFDSHPRYQPNI